MSASTAFGAALVGYILGSLSFARIVVALVARQPVAPIELITPDGEGRLVTDVVSASAVRLQLGPKWGVTVGLLDILKAFAPTLAFRLLAPGQPYFLIAAAAAVLGHALPIFHRFKGGVGQSPIIGGMLAISPLAAIATALLGQVIGLFVVRDGLAADALHVPLLVPWMWVESGGDLWVMGYTVVVNTIYFVAYWPVIAQYLRLRQEGHLPTPEHSMVMFEMDFGFMRRLAPERYAQIDRQVAVRREAGVGP